MHKNNLQSTQTFDVPYIVSYKVGIFFVTFPELFQKECLVNEFPRILLYTVYKHSKKECL